MTRNGATGSRPLARLNSNIAAFDAMLIIKNSNADGVPIRFLLSELRRRLFLLLALATCFMAVALIYSLIAAPVYRAYAVGAPVFVGPGAPVGGAFAGLAGIAELAGVTSDLGAETAKRIAVLESRALARLFIEKYDLLPAFYWRDWDASSKSWKPNSKEDIPTISDGISFFLDKVLDVDWNATTQLVTVSMKSNDRFQAAEWANNYLNLANAYIREREIAEATRGISFMRQELDKSNPVEIKQAIYRLIETQINRITMANVKIDYAFDLIDPAVVPEADEQIWPRPVLLSVAVFVFSVALGAALIVLNAAWRWDADEGRTG